MNFYGRDDEDDEDDDELYWLLCDAVQSVTAGVLLRNEKNCSCVKSSMRLMPFPTLLCTPPSVHLHIPKTTTTTTTTTKARSISNRRECQCDDVDQCRVSSGSSGSRERDYAQSSARLDPSIRRFHHSPLQVDRCHQIELLLESWCAVTFEYFFLTSSIDHIFLCFSWWLQRIGSFSLVCSASSRRTTTYAKSSYLTAASRNAPFFADQTDRVKVRFIVIFSFNVTLNFTVFLPPFPSTSLEGKRLTTSRRVITWRCLPPFLHTEECVPCDVHRFFFFFFLFFLIEKWRPFFSR